jgi:internalin A
LARKPSSRNRLKAGPDITCFIGYARADGLHYATQLAEALIKHGIDVLMDYDQIPPGSRWVERIVSRVQRADVFILVGTPAAFQSTFVMQELAFFYDKRNSRVLPILFGESDAFRLAPRYLLEFEWLREGEANLLSGPSERAISYLFQMITVLGTSPLVPKTERLRRPKKKQPLNEGKLILVGRGEVGKTSVVKRLMNKGFRGDESKTQGINIARWELKCKADSIRLNVWDFGGQEIMHATHQFFLTERSIYLLILNGREGGEDLDAEYWLKHIANFGGDSPIIIVQNKIAQHPFELNYRGLQVRYPQIRGFVKTDCKENVGIDELHQLLGAMVDTMPEVRMQFPLEWFKVKERLESMPDNFVSYDEFRRICSTEGVDIESERDTLSWTLHCLGIALNFRDDFRLRETSVLKPEWVTQGIYRILNASTVAARQGELNLTALRELLPAKQYPADKHPFLLELMRKFSLCFPFPDETDRYLIPELLGKEESPEVAKFVPNDCLNFEYHYGVLPEGLLPRFIVRSHTLSRGQQRWRSGAILAHEDCRALVIAQPGDRRIVIRVAGGDAGARRRLLAIVRYDVDRINADFKDRLDVQEKVPLTEFPSFSVDYRKLLAFEKQGVHTFPEFVGQAVVSVSVGDLLNGVDFETQRHEPAAALVNAKTIFFSYSHKDETLRDELETHLKLLQRQGIIAAWHDRKILAGDQWDREIDRHLERAKIILLLISADFIASDYCWGKEVERALERHNAKEARVIPVMLRPCDWRNAPFGSLQGLPKDMKPITKWRDRDTAWADVASGIRRIATALDSD